MIVKKLIWIFGLFISISSFGREDPFKARMDSSWNLLTDTTFDNLLKTNNLIFTMPENFEEIKVKKNYDIFYQYAIKDKNSNFEIRIFIKPFKGIFNDTANFNPNKFSYNFLASMSLNASGNILSNIPQIDLFPKDGVKKEFNADWGATTAFVPKTEFGRGFNFCALTSLRKDDLCEVYIFYMFDDVPNQESLIQKGFYVMKFIN